MIENSLKIGNYKPRREVGEPTVSSALKILALLVVLLVFPLSASASARLQMPPNYLTTGSGLVGYWTFDGKDTNWGTNKTNDLSGQGNTGTLTSMSTTTSPAIGKIGQGLKFSNAAQSEVLTTFTQQLNDFTACAWFYVNNADVLTNNYQRIIDKAYDTGFWMGHQGGGGASDQWGGGVIIGTYIFVTLATNQWHHLCSKRSGTTLTIIGDGGSVTNTVTVSGAALSTIPLRIASSYNAPINDALTGKVDDVRIYNRALSAGEVLNLYNIGKAKANVSNDVISNGLVGYWTFDGATTTWSSATAGITGDLSGNFNTGTLTNMNRATSPAIGKIGQGLKFDGVDDYVGTADSSSLDITDKITISAWVNSFSAANRTNYGRVLEKSKDTTECIEPYTIYDLIFLPTGEAKFDIAIGGLAKGMASITVPSLNTWYHLVGTYDGSNMRIYVNGALDNTLAQSGTLNTSNNGLRFADSSLAGPCGSGLFNGLVDDVRIYNRAVSAGEVGQLYQQGAAKVNKSPTSLLTNGLVGYWTFDGATTTWSSATAGITGDLSGNFNTGTLTNMSQSTNPAIGKIGQGLKFDGSNDYVNAGSGSSVNVTGAITACFWVKTSSSGMSGVMGNRGGSGNGGYVIMLRGEEGGGVNYRIGFTYFGVLDWYSSNNAYIANNQWQHLCVVNPATGNIRFYANGAQHSTAASANSGTSSDQPLYVGAWNNSGTPANYFNGLIDDVRIYNRALSANEVKQLYNIGR